MNVESLKKMIELKKEHLQEIEESLKSDNKLFYSEGHIIGYFEGQIDLLKILIIDEEMKESSE